jgi:AraC-like DNA-binding protein
LIKQRLDADTIGHTGALHAAPCRSASGGDVDVSGHITAALLDSGTSIEVMDYRFSQHTVVACDAQDPFIEFLDLESVEAVCWLGANSCPVAPGMHVTLCSEAGSQLVFSADVPVRGMRIRLPLSCYDNEILTKFPHDAPNHDFLRSYISRPFCDPQMRGVFQQIKSGIFSGIGSELYFESKLLELIHLFAVRRGSAGRCRDSLAQPVERVKRLLSERLSSPPTVAELAKLTNTCPSKLHRDFKRLNGCTIHEYLQHLRMTKARTLVSDSDEPLYRIARMVGYRKPGSFSKAYRQAYGQCPSQQRNGQQFDRP